MGVGLVRTLLAISVVFAHSSLVRGYNIANGLIAVQSFYIISGFYKALILNAKYTGRNGIWLFATNRFFRLYPIYWLMLLLSLGVSTYCYMTHGPQSGLYLRAWTEHNGELSLLQRWYLVGVNLFLFGQDSTLFLKLTQPGLLAPTRDFYATAPPLHSFLFVPQAWTLGVELLFYCVAPLIVRRSMAFMLSIISVSLVLRVTLMGMGLSNDPWTYRFFPAELALFCGGGVAYRIYRMLPTAKLTVAWIPPMMTFGIITALLLFNYLPGPYIVRQWIFYIALILSLPFMFIYSKDYRVDRFIGELSYPIYISHHLICMILSTHLNGSMFGAVTVVASVLVAITLQILVQEPIDKFRRNRMTGCA